VTSNFSYSCHKYYPPNAPGGWRYTDPTGGGPLLDVGIYLAFGIREILGERIAQVLPLNKNTFSPPGSQIADSTASCFITDKGTPGTFVTSFAHDAQYVNFYGTKGNLTVKDLFYQTPGAILECNSEEGGQYILNTKDDAGLAHYDNYRREFEHFSQCLLNKTQHSPSEDECLTDALLLDALKQNASTLAVPTPADFLK
ncbi:MAG: Gfo/Idh/MocA family oxidoreductase, partial [Luteolibacter sp.]